MEAERKHFYETILFLYQWIFENHFWVFSKHSSTNKQGHACRFCQYLHYSNLLHLHKIIYLSFYKRIEGFSGNCSHDIKKTLASWKNKAMTNLDSILKKQRHYFATKVCRVYIVKAVFFPAVTYSCESRTECQRTDQTWLKQLSTHAKEQNKSMERREGTIL